MKYNDIGGSLAWHLNRKKLSTGEFVRLTMEGIVEYEPTQVLSEMATVRRGRLFYGVSAKRLAQFRRKELGINAKATDEEIINKYQGKFFARGNIAGDQITLTYYYVENGITPNDVKEANKNQVPTDSMKGAEFKWEEERDVEVGRTKLGWLTSKGEELTAEMEELNSAKILFEQAGIGLNNPARITVIGTDGGKEVVDGVVGIDKITDKTAIGDFKLVNSEGKAVYSISHKALGFERYAALVSTLKRVQGKDKDAGKLASASQFLADCAARWKEDFLGGKTRSPKGFIRAVPNANTQDAIELIYGPLDENSADALFIGNLKLDKLDEGMFKLSVLPAENPKLGSSAAYVKTLPSTKDYMPVYRSRYGSGGSSIALEAEEIEFLNHQILAGERSIDEISEWVGKKLQVKEISKDDALQMCSETRCGDTVEIVENIKIPVRYYISPARRADGGATI